jgi:hypothetical protein
MTNTTTTTSSSSSSTTTTAIVSSTAAARKPGMGVARFYATSLPQTYVLAAATVLSYTLVIMLLITPRTFFIAGAGHAGGFLGRGRGLITGATGSSAVVGVGSRPWLQKIATLTVAVSLTIATVQTFSAARQQYRAGRLDAVELHGTVVSGLEIRIVRFISDTLLWLAQAQTLVRLFPRQREKIIIKWTALALIALDTIFSALDYFVFFHKAHPRSARNAVPALRYLFQLALSVLYALWVVYYSFSKRKYAYYHKKMRNICLVAALALTSVLVPIVFFAVDVSKPDVAGWGEYVRWVGAAAASVIVWEWVERIEAIEREELQEGVLGREVFDGDDASESAASASLSWPRGRRRMSEAQETRPPGPGTAGKFRSRLDTYLTAKTAVIQSKFSRHERQSRLPVTVIPAPARSTHASQPTGQAEASTAAVELVSNPCRPASSLDQR